MSCVKTDLKPFYERNDHIINSDINVFFEDLLEMKELWNE